MSCFHRTCGRFHVFAYINAFVAELKHINSFAVDLFAQKFSQIPWNVEYFRTDSEFVKRQQIFF